MKNKNPLDIESNVWLVPTPDGIDLRGEGVIGESVSKFEAFEIEIDMLRGWLPCEITRTVEKLEGEPIKTNYVYTFDGKNTNCGKGWFEHLQDTQIRANRGEIEPHLVTSYPAVLFGGKLSEDIHHKGLGIKGPELAIPRGTNFGAFSGKFNFGEMAEFYQKVKETNLQTKRVRAMITSNPYRLVESLRVPRVGNFRLHLIGQAD